MNDDEVHKLILYEAHWFPEEYISTLKTFEYRLQTCIINTTPDDVKQLIKGHHNKIYLKDNKMKYNDNEIEFLQILHDGIKSRKLSIFDSVYYDLLIKKLKQ